MPESNEIIEAEKKIEDKKEELESAQNELEHAESLEAERETQTLVSAAIGAGNQAAEQAYDAKVAIDELTRKLDGEREEWTKRQGELLTLLESLQVELLTLKPSQPKTEAVSEEPETVTILPEMIPEPSNETRTVVPSENGVENPEPLIEAVVHPRKVRVI